MWIFRLLWLRVGCTMVFLLIHRTLSIKLGIRSKIFYWLSSQDDRISSNTITQMFAFFFFSYYLQFSYIDFLYEVISSNELTLLKNLDTRHDSRCCSASPGLESPTNCNCRGTNQQQQSTSTPSQSSSASNSWPTQEELSRCFSVWRMEGELNTGKT